MEKRHAIFLYLQKNFFCNFGRRCMNMGADAYSYIVPASITLMQPVNLGCFKNVPNILIMPSHFDGISLKN